MLQQNNENFTLDKPKEDDQQFDGESSCGQPGPVWK